MTDLLYITLGLIAGSFSGLIGIGGGVIIVPALVYFFKMSQHQAQGTTLALLIPPVGLLAALDYYRQGYINWKVATLVCIGFFLGGFIGARLANSLPDVALGKIFGIVLLMISLKMIFTH